MNHQHCPATSGGGHVISVLFLGRRADHPRLQHTTPFLCVRPELTPRPAAACCVEKRGKKGWIERLKSTATKFRRGRAAKHVEPADDGEGVSWSGDGLLSDKAREPSRQGGELDKLPMVRIAIRCLLGARLSSCFP